ncbi:Pr6Pr family membrane protein [Microbacterium chocolatum]|uniref:Pr6Pr family membrane protein n=1 Tax=Microbacterium aurantiacum TaxID=162393 RepID=UPI00338D4B49
MHARTRARIWQILRLLMAAVVIAAVVSQLARSVGIAAEAGRDVGTTIANFLSFFTILSNISAAVVLAVAGVLGLRRPHVTDGTGLAVALASVTTYMVITGVVYNLLLRGIELAPGTTVPWSNEVLHVVAPLFLALDLFLGPRRRALEWRVLWAIVAFPIVWVVYTMVRGTLVTNPVTGDPFWYPYPFLNPNNPALQPPGYAGVAVYVVGIAVGIVLVGAAVVVVGRRRAQRSAGASGSSASSSGSSSA